MASRPPRFERTISRQVAPIDPLAGAAEAELAQELEAFSERLSANLDRQAAESAFLEGQQSGADPDRSEFTIRGRAFNRGVIASQQAAQQTDIRDSVERFELENDADPEAFDAKVTGLLEGILEEANPQLHPFIRQRMADYSGRVKSRIIGRQQAELEKEAINDLRRGAQGMLDDATTAAFEGDILMIETRRQEINEMLQVGIEAGLLEEGGVAVIQENFERAVTSQEVIGNFDRLVRDKGPDEGAKAIGKWQEVKPSSVGLTAEDHAAVTRQMVALRNREISLMDDNSAKVAAAARAETNLRQGRVDDAIRVLSDGFPLDQEQADQVTADIAHLTTTGEADDIQRAQELAADFDVANAIQGQVHAFRRMSAPNRDNALIALQRDLRTGASADEVALLKALQKTSADVNRELETDPRGYLNREGLVEDPALDFSSAEALAGSLAARDTDAGSQLAGEPIGILTAAEADQLSQVFEQAEIEEQVALLGVITAGSGEEAEATLQQIDSKGHEQMALLGGYVMQGRGLLAREILRGQQILAADPGVKPKRIDYQASIDDQWGGAMGDWPEQRATVLDAAFAKYAELKSRTGDLSDEFDPKAMDQALDAVMPTARFNGRRVAIPPGITEDRFDDWTESWDTTTFAQPVGITPQIAPLVAHGRANAAAGQLVTDAKGIHSIFSISVSSNQLNNGRETVIPTVYDGKIVSEKEAIERAVESGIQWPSADTVEEATEISKEASDAMAQFDEVGRATMAVPGITAEEMLDVVRDDGRLVELGNGRYGVAVVSAASGLDRFLVKEDGTPFMLEFPRQVE